jgi:hypothetical protein
MEKMLFTTSGIGRLRTTAAEIIKIDDDSLDSFSITTVLAKYRLASEQRVEIIIEMITKEATSSRAINGTLPVQTDKITGLGSRGHMYHPRIS